MRATFSALAACLILAGISFPLGAAQPSPGPPPASSSSFTGTSSSSPGTSSQSRYTESFPSATSIKGLQVEVVPDAIDLGVKHAALNFNLSQLASPNPGPTDPAWEHNGRNYRFNAAYLDAMDRQIKPLSDAGLLVYIIVLAYASHDESINRLTLHPAYDPKAPNHLGAFNTATPEGRAWLSAALEFCAERWARPDRSHGRVVGYIVGNEVNSHWWWSNMGRVNLQTFTLSYAQAVRIIHSAVRRQSSSARIYVSLEHHWNIRYPAGDDMQAFPGRAFLELFARQVRLGGDFDWHLAFHPYPENLFEPRFWNDRSATANADTPRITFKNIEVLVRFMGREPMQYAGTRRRIILSEQGFHTPPGPDGETVQAAAFCAAYRKVEAVGGIDAFILHRHIDHDGEGGLWLGLRRNKPAGGEERPRKRIYDCFRLADTPQWQDAFRFALPIVGLDAWPPPAPK